MATRKPSLHPAPKPPKKVAEQIRALIGSAENLGSVARLASATIGTAKTDLDAVATAADALAEILEQIAKQANEVVS